MNRWYLSWRCCDTFYYVL